MENVEEDKSKEHKSGVEDVLVGFVAGNAAVDAFGVLDEAEYYSDLGVVGWGVSNWGRGFLRGDGGEGELR